MCLLSPHNINNNNNNNNNNNLYGGSSLHIKWFLGRSSENLCYLNGILRHEDRNVFSEEEKYYMYWNCFLGLSEKKTLVY